MPDVHRGLGATVGSVIATHRAVIPAAVGVDIGCGMIAVRTSLRAEQLPETCARCARPSRRRCRTAVPTTAAAMTGARGARPRVHREAWAHLKPGYDAHRPSTRGWTVARTWITSARSGRGTTSSRCAWTRLTRCG